MPVSFNEPLTMLERAAEELEYFDLLDQASLATDETERMCFIAAFAVSGYACTKNRSGRKSLCVLSPLHAVLHTDDCFSNPMLAETYEEPRMHFIAEKVVHNPLVIAYHAEGEGWELTGTSSGKTKFWGENMSGISDYSPADYTVSAGKSLEIIPTGKTILRIGQETYEWYVVRCSSCQG
jgi:oxysterol-binding protein-related protein 3/6/7